MTSSEQPRVGPVRLTAAFVVVALLVLAAALAKCEEHTAHETTSPDTAPAPAPAPLPRPPMYHPESPPKARMEIRALPDRHLVRALRLRPSTGLPQAARALWPSEEWPNVYAIEGCESHHSRDPNTYRLDTPSGGRMQIHRATWEDILRETFGWTWKQVVMNDAVNYRAAYFIWARAGGSWEPWDCEGATNAN